MAHFRGTLKGSRGETSRLGTKHSDIQSILASWDGAVVSTIFWSEAKQKNVCEIRQIKHCGKGVNAVMCTFVVGE